MFGAGGASIRVPHLIMAGMPLVNAFVTNIFAIPFSSASGAYTAPQHSIGHYKDIHTRGHVRENTCNIPCRHHLRQDPAISFFLIAMLTVFALYLDIISPRLYNKVRPSPPNLFFGSSRHDLFVCWKQGIHAN